MKVQKNPFDENNELGELSLHYGGMGWGEEVQRKQTLARYGHARVNCGGGFLLRNRRFAMVQSTTRKRMVQARNKGRESSIR